MTGADATARAVQPIGPVDATVDLPGSKSITNRAMVCAALARGVSRLRGALEADDTVAMSEGLRSIGIPVARGDGGDLYVSGRRIADRPSLVNARQSGTTARFLLPVLGLSRTRHLLTGDPQLLARPMGPSFRAIEALGGVVDERSREDHLPAMVVGPIRSGIVQVPGVVSSQFLSGVLLVGPAVHGGIQVHCTTPLVSVPYVEMTLTVMRSFGAYVEHQVVDGLDRFLVAGTGYTASDYTIEPDASAASYAWAAAAATGGRVTVRGLSDAALQGDVAFVDVLEAMGAKVDRGVDEITVSGTGRLVGVDVDLAAISDTVPTLAAIAPLAEGETRIRGVGFIRHKETDRIAAPVTELRRLGVDAEETDDGMVIRGGPTGPAVVDTYRDHRMAMAFAVLGLAREGVSIADPGCVAKTFPGYWDLLDRLAEGTFPPAARA